MRTRGELPVHIDPEHDELKQQHRAWYNVRRARDGLTTRVFKINCAIFLTLLFIFGVVAFILWLSLHPHRPRFHIQDFSPKNTTILFGVLAGATLTVNKERWMQFQGNQGKGRVVFPLDLTWTVRFKVSRWQSKHHKMHANCEVGVGPDGSIWASYKGKRCPVYFTWQFVLFVF
ncbi:hypothetical protein NMG60_11022415 [Bertholletia excelsa]